MQRDLLQHWTVRVNDLEELKKAVELDRLIMRSIDLQYTWTYNVDIKIQQNEEKRFGDISK